MRPERKRLHRGALPGAASSAPGPRSQPQRLWQTKGDEGCLGRPFSSLGRSVPVWAVVWVGLCEPRFLPALSVFGSAHFPLKAPRILPVPGPHPTKKSPVGRSMCVLTPTEKSEGERIEGCDRGQGALFLSWRPTTPGSSARGRVDTERTASRLVGRLSPRASNCALRFLASGLAVDPPGLRLPREKGYLIGSAPVSGPIRIGEQDPCACIYPR